MLNGSLVLSIKLRFLIIVQLFPHKRRLADDSKQILKSDCSVVGVVNISRIMILGMHVMTLSH